MLLALNYLHYYPGFGNTEERILRPAKHVLDQPQHTRLNFNADYYKLRFGNDEVQDGQVRASPVFPRP
jgi:hypothetical protein